MYLYVLLNQTTLLLLDRHSLHFWSNYLRGGWLGGGIFLTFLLHLQLYVLTVHLYLRKNLLFPPKYYCCLLFSLVGVKAGDKGRTVCGLS